MPYIIVLALVTGMVGSLHCVGMCGPLVLGLPFYTLPKHKAYVAMFLYNVGRAISYSFLGLLIGLVGNFASIIGWLQALSVVSGIVIVLLSFSQISFLPKFYWLAKFQALISKALAKAVHNNNIGSFFKIGLLNGLLPCGLVYIALLTSLALGSVTKSTLFMFFFGIGTFPLMLSLLLLNYKLSLNFRNQLQKIIPVFAVCIGCILILRGLNLNIPFLSPQLTFENGKPAVSCH